MSYHTNAPYNPFAGLFSGVVAVFALYDLAGAATTMAFFENNGGRIAFDPSEPGVNCIIMDQGLWMQARYLHEYSHITALRIHWITLCMRERRLLLAHDNFGDCLLNWQADEIDPHPQAPESAYASSVGSHPGASPFPFPAPSPAHHVNHDGYATPVRALSPVPEIPDLSGTDDNNNIDQPEVPNADQGTDGNLTPAEEVAHSRASSVVPVDQDEAAPSRAGSVVPVGQPVQVPTTPVQAPLPPVPAQGADQQYPVRPLGVGQNWHQSKKAFRNQFFLDENGVPLLFHVPKQPKPALSTITKAGGLNAPLEQANFIIVGSLVHTRSAEEREFIAGRGVPPGCRVVDFAWLTECKKRRAFVPLGDWLLYPTHPEG